ncbi:MAG: iron ABC transporter permease [Spirochaetaceae bacterium]|jgi:iron complex transport system permease protein|nr:iron ABC transporter permease [Spirochaetaceae bacterium]
MGMGSQAKTYRGYIRYKLLFMLVLAAVMVFVALIAVSSGSSGIPAGDVLSALVWKGSNRARIVLWNIRMPRVLTAIFAGAGLASAGCAMQSILKNPLASASTLGISQGAAFGASFAIIVLGAGIQNQTAGEVTFTNPWLVSFCAFVSAMFSTMVVLGLSRLVKASPEALVLSGVALSSLFAGATTLVQYFASDVKLAAVIFWTFGDLGRTGWKEILIMAVISIFALVYFLLNRWNYNALQNGEETARGLGVDTGLMRLAGMFVCSIAAATIVSFVGIINFIGLIAPHLARRFTGGDHRFLLPASALTGALLLLLSDTLGRLAAAPVIMPIGAITSFLGAPLFLYLVFKRSKKRW